MQPCIWKTATSESSMNSSSGTLCAKKQTLMLSHRDSGALCRGSITQPMLTDIPLFKISFDHYFEVILPLLKSRMEIILLFFSCW